MRGSLARPEGVGGRNLVEPPQWDNLDEIIDAASGSDVERAIPEIPQDMGGAGATSKVTTARTRQSAGRGAPPHQRRRLEALPGWQPLAGLVNGGLPPAGQLPSLTFKGAETAIGGVV